MKPFLIDTHCHLDMEQFLPDQDAVIQRAQAAGVELMITIGTGGGLQGAHNAIQLAERHECVWASVGIHPHDAGLGVDLAGLRPLAEHPKVVAIGETGLDFYRDWAPIDAQEETFIAQIELARSVKKPLIIHSRDAGDRCLTLLKEHNASEVGGVFHCFSENSAFAKELRTLGFMVSFPGQVTFKKAHDVRATCLEIPLDQILLETDSPFLAPEPHRGKRCEPAFMIETARRIALEKSISLEKLGEITSKNASALFKGITIPRPA